MTKTINAEGLAIVEEYEGLVLTATPDPVGVLTIGYGHTLGVTAGETITKAQALQLLAQDLLLFEGGVASVATSPTSNQFSAMVSLAFNIGQAAFNTSTVLKDHNAGNHAGAAGAFALWDKAHVNGQLVTLPGLVARRTAEAALYSAPDAPTNDTVIETYVDQSGVTHQIIDRTLGAASVLRCSSVAVALALALWPRQTDVSGPITNWHVLGYSAIEPESTHDWLARTSTFRFDRDPVTGVLHTVPLEGR